MNTVLLVDDDDLLRGAMRINLTRCGFVVVEACDGEEAIDKAAEVRPDIVLLDLVMPNVDGIEALRTMRTRVPDAKFIVMSGGTQNTDPGMYLKMAMALGAHAAIRKPFTNEQLVAAVSDVQDSATASRA
ncbi:MAG TPA: response regulator [Rhizomicrobium sp.]|nr:response regulator [Rhizomicrobium sp.]